MVPVSEGIKSYRGCYYKSMRRMCTIALAILVALMCLPQAWAASGDSDARHDTDLTKYLHTHHLPLVSAQLLSNPDGTRQVVLYGFTATDFGKQDAVTKSRRFLNDSAISISNRIKVRPELGSEHATAGSVPNHARVGTSDENSDQGDAGDASSEASSQPAKPDATNLQNQSQRDIQSYADQQQQASRQQPGMGSMGGGMGPMGGGSGLTFGSNGMGMSIGSLGALLGMAGGSGGSLDGLMGLLGGNGGSGSYGSGSSGYQNGPPPGYGSGGYGSSGYGSSAYGPPPYGPQGYPPGNYPSNGNPSGGYPY
jgi:hypothetical protein